MKMKRRGFLGWLAAAPSAAVVTPAIARPSFDFVEVASPAIELPSDTLTDLLTTTLANRQAKLAANILSNNDLLRKLKATPKTKAKHLNG